MDTPDLKRLEAESIGIMREVAAEFRNPVMLYSIGKDSGVMLHLALKAFYPSKPPFPLLHVDTGWKFRDMIRHRDAIAARYGVKLLVYTNPGRRGPRHQSDRLRLPAAYPGDEDRGAEAGARPVWIRRGLRRRAPRRGEEPRQGAGVLVPLGRATSGIRAISARSCGSCTTPASPRARPSGCSRCPTGRSSTSGRYTRAEDIPVVPLYFAAPRPVVEPRWLLIMRDDERMPLLPGEEEEMRMVRFRSLGCYPLSAAIESPGRDAG